MCDERRVLVVDDTDHIRELLHDILTFNGYLVTLAHHGAHGLRLIASARPCVILLDLQMPVMDGQEFVRAYRQTPPSARLHYSDDHVARWSSPRSGVAGCSASPQALRVGRPA